MWCCTSTSTPRGVVVFTSLVAALRPLNIIRPAPKRTPAMTHPTATPATAPPFTPPDAPSRELDVGATTVLGAVVVAASLVVVAASSVEASGGSEGDGGGGSGEGGNGGGRGGGDGVGGGLGGGGAASHWPPRSTKPSRMLQLEWFRDGSHISHALGGERDEAPGLAELPA